MSDEQIPGIDKEKTHLTPIQVITIPELLPGSILDIGGGGEGVIGQAGGKRVTSIDLRESEIEEAKERGSEATFMVADATDLPFEDNEFDHATSFFTGMYMYNEDKVKSMKEVYRTLKPNGEFWYWDSVIHDDKELFLIFVRYILPNKKEVQTGYGCKIFKEQSMDTIKKMLEETGFTVEVTENHKYWYFLKAKKL